MHQIGNGEYHQRTGRLVYRCVLLCVVVMWGCDDESKSTKEDTDSLDTADAGEPDAGGGDSEAPGNQLPDCASQVDPELAEADADELFSDEHVPTFDIYLPPEEWEDLQANAVEEQYTEAQACFDGRGIGKVGLRFKGAYGTLYGCFDGEELICPRLSIKLKFNKYVEDQRFFGLKRLNFNANRNDDTRMKEKLAYDLYRSMGITAPRAAWAVVRVNGKSYGLYGMVEQIDGRFTDNRWPDYPDNNLYKEIWPTDTDEDAVIRGLRTNEEDADVSSFLAFSEAIVAADESEVLSTLGEYTDLEHWARYMAVDEAILSYDGITYFFTDTGEVSHNHNYYFYEDSPGHFTLIPWDVEATFWINPDHAAPHWTEKPEDCTQTYPYWGGLATAPGCDRIFKALKNDLGAEYAAAQELLDGPFALEKMEETIDRYVALIGEEARKEETPTMYSNFDDAVGFLRSTIVELRARLSSMIAAADSAADRELRPAESR